MKRRTVVSPKIYQCTEQTGLTQSGGLDSGHSSRLAMLLRCCFVGEA